ncbi:MAG TPA: hypothetical protein VGU66_08645 [Candidatus Elarobacter sp.]|nr:hypothetical protein [Candidatus Elarobacter sp.]
MNSSVPPASPDHATAQAQTRAVSDKGDNHKKDVDYGYTLFGDATLVHPGNASNTAAQATSTGLNAYGGVDFAFPAGATYSQLTNLSTDYRFTVGTCGVGSPRFVITLTNGTVTGNVNFYIGPPPNYTGCPPNVWANTGNLASGLVDDSQLPGGTFYDPYAASQTKFGAYAVTDVFVVVDGYQPPYQTVQFDNSFIGIGTDQTTYTYEKGPDHGANDGDKDDKHKRHHEHDD